MASCSLRLRRALTTLSTVNRYVCSTPTVLSAPTSISFSITTPPFTSPPSQFTTKLARGFSPFKLSSMSFSSDRYFNKDEIGPDTILFEGCDYNHWLITMDFPKDPKPTPEEMVRTYEETCAKGLNISLEEAKQRMYACSTTTYQGFQAVMTEEESEKFKDIPGVVFILPDSYIDPQNKEYGGDKYINGTIIPRPPPVQYGRQGGRFRDRNRNPDPPRYDGGSKPNWQENNPSNNQQGPMQRDGRDFGASQNYSPPQPGYGQPGQGEMRGGSMPPYQGNNQGGQGGYNNQGGRGNYYPQRDQRGYGPPPRQGGFGQGDNRGYGPLPQGGPYGQGQGGYQGQGANQGGNWQGAGSGYGPGYQGHGDGQRNGQGEETLYTPTGQPGSYQGRY